ncbi:Coenzyme F420 hydrogenase/dehydrogenase, beta subunit C-terminal domain [Butyrivibrio fibrisolvens]|uniref:Coenzyme F420 hydrogenase/dehydrogenase, beta subunit C-terminal domain n=1 Tax=Butyrivibrio fibrisolvens TaxID=831 RepID=UPI0003F93774|nr:Coenzyme F420 hydrogenase/dehydrogenase, beta subunit C-terminal domain [Butyrivibrio fibrisolvens]
MITITDKAKCCGCEACVNICPQKCLEIKIDDEGFGYPVVANNKCINCKLCEKVCPMDKNKENKNDLLLSYVGKTRNEDILHSSTSGGIFTQIASAFISDGGIVYGAAYDDAFSVKHVRCTDNKKLFDLSGSKYVQSRLGDVYVQIRDDLKNNKKVLFCGTPCQINGLLGFIGNDENLENLITIDIICRAVPSPLLWDKYVKYLDEKYDGQIKKYRMRDKINGYQFSHFVSYDKDGEVVYKGGTFVNQYLRAFFSGICNRPSCYCCKFKTVKRLSDLTIGDCFYSMLYGVSDKEGASVIIIHTEKGEKIFNGSDLQKKAVDIDEVVKRSKEITHSTGIDSRRSSFLNDLNNIPISEVLDKYYPMTLSIYYKYFLRVLLSKLGLHDFIKRLFIRLK